MNQRPIALASLLVLAACGGDDNPVDPDAAPADAAPDAPPPVTVTVAVDALPTATYAVVYRDGDGAWLRATDAGGGDYTFPVATGRYGVGFTCAEPLWQEGTFSFAATSDPPPALYVTCGYSGLPPVLHRVSGSITGLTGGGYRARIGLSSVFDPTAGATATYDVDEYEATSTSLQFGRLSADGDHVDRLVIRRDVAITGDLVQNVAFATQGTATESRDVTIGGAAPGELVSVGARFRAGTGFGMTLTRDAAEPFTVELPAASAWNTGDSHAISASADSADGSYRDVSGTFAAVADVPASFAWTLPPALADATVTPLQGAAGFQFRAAAQAAAAAEGYDVFVYSYGVTNAGCDLDTCYPYWSMSATPAYAAAGLQLVTPDPEELDAIGAWDERLALPAGTTAYTDLEEHHVDGDLTYHAGVSAETDL